MNPAITRTRTRIVTAMMLLSAAPLAWSQTPPPGDKEVLALDPFSVTAKEDASGYGVTSSTSLTRLNTPLRDVPQTVNIVTARFMKELAAPTLGEAIAFLPSVTTRGGGPDQFQIRSIDVFSQFRNSFRYSTGTSLNYLKDLSNIERVEVIKGLGSATTGRGEAGGVLNLITKKPQSRQSTTLRATAGSWGYYKGEFDTTGPVNQSGSVLYRLIAAYTGGGTYLDNEEYDQFAIYPSMQFRFNDRTDLLIEGSVQAGRTPSSEFFEIQDERQFYARASNGQVIRTFPPDGALAQIKMMPLSTPQSASFLDPHAAVYEVTTTLNHKFAPWFSTRQGLLLFKGQVDRESTRLRGFGNYVFAADNPLGPPIDWTMALRDDLTETDSEFASYQGDFLFDYHLGSLVNQTLVGYEYTKRHIFNRFSRAETGGIFRILDNSAFLNLKRSDLPPKNVTTWTIRDVTEASAYIQHSVKFWQDKVQLLGGWRYDDVYEDINDLRANKLTKSRPDPTDGTYRFGGSYRALPWLTVFAVHAQQRDPVNTQLRYPEGNKGITSRDPSELISAARSVKLEEVGLKSELYGGRMTFNVSYYKIEEGSDIRSVNFRTNRNDELDPLYNWRENVIDPSSTAEGVEIEISGAPTERLSFYGSAAFAHTALNAVQADGSVLSRKRRGDCPARLNFAGNYLFHKTGDWSFYGQTALAFTDDVVLNPDNIVLQSSSLRWDLGVRIVRRASKGAWEAQVRMQNVLDDRITTGTANSGTMPRRLSAMVERRF